ncbi:MAG TPA: ribulose-phosphate 3-epimerase [Vicinamibacteria bacterium]|nr:ribulose-phosphate 3-epimerase [Vicinamibacteria bacterium]
MILAPSILACDLGHLADQIEAVERGGAGAIHVDVMDGRFAPNISLGPAIVEACRRATRLPVDAHLMVERAELYLDAFVDAGASSVSVHVEAVPHLQRALDHLRKRGARAGVALDPSTPIGTLEEILPETDFVLILSVNPGFSFQTFLPSSLDKIRRLRRAIQERGLPTLVQVDGGVHAGNIRSVVEAGVEIVVAGAAAFAAGDPEAAVRGLLEAARGGR